MNSTKLKISRFLDSQLPNFIVEEFPRFKNFFEGYYKSLEIPGGILDISNNLLEYFDVETFKQNNLVSEFSLASAISSDTLNIVLNSVDGLPETEGLVQIDSEIIFYERVDKSTKTLVNCKRGYSATTELKDFGTTVVNSVASSHSQLAKVVNLSNLLLFALLKNYQNQYLDGFPFTEINSEVEQSTLIHNIKQFYEKKGTASSIQFLFRSIFDEEASVRYPREYLLKASTSDWTVDDIIKVISIEGNPFDIVGNEIYQADKADTPEIKAIVDNVIVNNISSYNSGGNLIYEIRLNILSRNNFKVPSSTFLRNSLSNSQTTITVDSTIGFPEQNGVIEIDDEIIFYRRKSFNQFLECTRGYLNTVESSHLADAKVGTTEYLYGYVGGDKSNNIVKMKLLGVLSSVEIKDGGLYYEENQRASVSDNGIVDTKKQFTSWLINENGEISSSGDTYINQGIKNSLCNVAAIYKDNNYAYVASAGFPRNVGPFVGTPRNFPPGNQLHLKKIPLIPEQTLQLQPVGRGAVGMFVDGVQAFSNKDYQKVNYGKIANVTIDTPGFGFIDDIAPIIRVSGGGGTGAVLSAKSLNGRITSVKVENGGSNYTSVPKIEIGYGFDATAKVESNLDLDGGKIKNITVLSSGTNYILPPQVVIRDISGRGYGAYAVARISNGIVVGIDVLNGGSEYYDPNSIVVELLSPGRDCVLTANLLEWNYDRVFILHNNFDTTQQKWEPSNQRKVDPGNGYLYFGLDNSLGLEYGYAYNPKRLRNILNDNVGSISVEYSENSSDLVHSPIVGWAYDGHPIYGPYGYSNPLQVSTIKRLESGYKLKTNISSDRPPVSRYPLGAFIEDYEYLGGVGDLDSRNGRFCVTPDFPNGTYAYFLTINSSGNGVFPYILGDSYNSVPIESNFLSSFRQNEISLPSAAKRIRTSKTPNEGFDVDLQISQVSRGSISSYEIGNSEPRYKVGDFVYLNGKDTEGSGALATVDSVFGVTVSSLTYSVVSGTTLSGVPLLNDLPLYPSILTTNENLQYEATLKTTTPHNLSNNDQIFVNLQIPSTVPSKIFKVRVSSYQILKYNIPTASTTLTANVSFNQTIIGVESVENFSLNDYIYINRELCKIVEINRSAQQLTIERNETQRLHNAGDSVALYIPPDQNDYRISLGDIITDGTNTGIISGINKSAREIEIRVTSGEFTSSSLIYDKSLPDQRPIFDGRKRIRINSIDNKKSYWEIDATNTGNYYTRALNFSLFKGTRYIFDVSHPSNQGFILSFSRDINNLVGIFNVTASGTPGTPNSTVILSETNFIDIGVSKIYYFEKNQKLINTNSSFDIKNNYFTGLFNVTKIDDYTVKYKLSGQPEFNSPQVSSYYTFSKTAIGSINEIKSLDGGKDYKKLPEVLGISHIESDSAKFAVNIVSGQINSVQILNPGSRYSSNTELYVNSISGSGAVLIPIITSGRIVSVQIKNSGNGYSLEDVEIIAVDRSNDIFPVSETIGKIKTINIINYGSQLNLDRTLSKLINFNYNLIVTNFMGNLFKAGELINSNAGSNLECISLYKISNKSYILKVKLISGELKSGDILTGVREFSTCTVKKVENSNIFGNTGGYIQKSGSYASDLGKLSSFSQKLTDSYYYQDYSYVIRSTKSLKDYENLIKKSTHPAGFKLFGEVAVETEGKSDTKFAKLIKTEICITSPGIKVESTLKQIRRTVQIINSKKVTEFEGNGIAINNFENVELDSKQIDDISDNFGLTNTYPLRSRGDAVPDLTQNELLLTINEVFQEPIHSKNISSVVYSGGFATITTTTNHNFATTISGITYPKNQIITISGVTASGVNLSDIFYVYEVPSPNTFVVLIENPNQLSGTAQLNSAKALKGNYEITNKLLKFNEPVPEKGTFNSSYYKFVNPNNINRYVYKLENIVFDGIQSKFEIRTTNGTKINPELDENLLLFIDGVLQYYGETYTIERNVASPDYGKIVFTEPPSPERTFYAYSFSKYKYFDDFIIDGKTSVFELKFAGENFKVTNQSQVLVLIDGVPQKYGDSYIIKDSIISFNEVILSGRTCKILYFYGRTFDKKITLYNSDIFNFSALFGEVTLDSCPIYTTLPHVKAKIKAGDKLVLTGESPKEIVEVSNRFVKRGDYLENTITIFGDNSYINGKNAVATAVLSGYTISGVTTSGIGNIIIEAPGLGYEVPPIIIFKNDCLDTGTEAEAKAEVLNGKLTKITVTNPGKNYTKPPEILFGKKYNIIKDHYPIEEVYDTTLYYKTSISSADFLNVKISKNDSLYNIELPLFDSLMVNYNSDIITNSYIKLDDIILKFDKNNIITQDILFLENLDVKVEQKIIPLITGIETSISITKNSILNTHTGVADDSTYNLPHLNSNPKTPKLGTKLKTFETNKFNYFSADSGIGCGFTIADLTRYMPNLTISHFNERPYSEIGSFQDPPINFALDSYLTYGSYLAENITSEDIDIELTSTSGFPSSGRVLIGTEIVNYQSIQGNILKNCNRGIYVLSGYVEDGYVIKLATEHFIGEYVRVLW